MAKFFKRAAKGCIVWVFLIALLAPATAHAQTYNVTELSDWYFILDQETEIFLYGNSDQGCNDADWNNTGTDPYLFLYDYDDNDTYLTEDDDANHNSTDQCVSSKITGTYAAGIYRIRAGYYDPNSGSTIDGTTGNPDYEEQDWGDLTYTLVTNSIPLYDTAPSIGPPMNLTITDNGDETITLDWDEPNTGWIEPERYAISWRIPPDAGWGIATGNVGDEDATKTEITISYSSFESSGGLNETYYFDVRSDNDTYSYYSGWSNEVSLYIGQVDTDGDGVYDDDETEGCINSVDCDSDGTGDKDDPDDKDPDVPVLTVDTDGDGVYDAEEEEGCKEAVDCDKDGVDDKTDPDDKDPDVPNWTVDSDGDGVFDKGEEVGCVWDVDCDKDGTGDKNDPDDKDPDVPVLTVDTDNDGVFDKEEEVGCANDPDCDKDGTDDKNDPDDKDPDVPVLTIDNDGDGVFDQEEEFGCAELVDCDFDGTDDKNDPDDKDPDVPFLTIDSDNDGVFDAEEKLGCEFLEDCDGDGFLDIEDPDPLDPNVPEEKVLIDGEEVVFEFIDEETGESLSTEEFFDEFEVAEEDQDLALGLNDLGIDIEDVDLSEIDDAEEKIIEALDELDEELAEDFLDVVDGDVTEEEIEDLFEDEDAFETLIEDNDEVIAIIVDAVNEADDDVKEQFEEEVNIFEDEAYNDYIAAGSNIDTEDRRVIVAAAATATVAAAAARPTAPPPPAPKPPPPMPSGPMPSPTPSVGGSSASVPAPSSGGSGGGGSSSSAKKTRRFGRRN